jgi:hypothetical protein
MFHGFSNGAANPNANPPLPTDAQLYDALTNWVEKGIVPSRLDIASPQTTENPVQKTFPLCVYPLKATFIFGDAKSAGSYACTWSLVRVTNTKLESRSILLIAHRRKSRPVRWSCR